MMVPRKTELRNGNRGRIRTVITNSKSVAKLNGPRQHSHDGRSLSQRCGQHGAQVALTVRSPHTAASQSDCRNCVFSSRRRPTTSRMERFDSRRSVTHVRYEDCFHFPEAATPNEKHIESNSACKLGLARSKNMAAPL